MGAMSIPELPVFPEPARGKVESNWDEELASMTSESSVADILQLLQEKRGSRGATVHGSNVWEMMQAAARAREKAYVSETFEFEQEAVVVDPTTEYSDDMWFWSSDDSTTVEPIIEEEELEPMQLDSDDMWCWNNDEAAAARLYGAEVPAVREDKLWLGPGASDQDVKKAALMWEWGWQRDEHVPGDQFEKKSELLHNWAWRRSEAEPVAHDKKAELLWNWAWRRGQGEPCTADDKKAELLWDWAWRRSEAEPVAHDKKAELLWNWAWRRGQVEQCTADDKKAELLWDWAWRRSEVEPC